MTDSVAIALACVWLFCPFAALSVLRWHYRREVARNRRASAPAEDLTAEWAPEWGPDWP